MAAKGQGQIGWRKVSASSTSGLVTNPLQSLRMLNARMQTNDPVCTQYSRQRSLQ